VLVGPYRLNDDSGTWAGVVADPPDAVVTATPLVGAAPVDVVAGASSDAGVVVVVSPATVFVPPLYGDTLMYTSFSAEGLCQYCGAASMTTRYWLSGL